MKTGQGICGGLGTQTYKNLGYTGPSFHWDLKVTVLINSLVHCRRSYMVFCACEAERHDAGRKQ